ncbi:MAG: endonuclease domain-containing protein [Solirubrobacterales bacterium]
MAVVLACGDGALLSHRDAASLWGILATSAAGVDVTAPGRSRSGQAGIALHLPRRVHFEDRAVEQGIPVTSVARTLLDLAEVVRARQLARAVEQAERLELFDLHAVQRLIDRSHGRRGLRRLNRALRDYRPLPFTRSELERRFLEQCHDAGPPQPSANMFIAGGEVDVVWPPQRLVVELDGYEFHRTRRSFEEDRLRDARLQRAGDRVLRITHRQLTGQPEETIATVRALLPSPA